MCAGTHQLPFGKNHCASFLAKLADSIDAIYETRLKNLIRDPWLLRDDYSAVLLGSEKIDELIQRHASQSLTPGQKIHGKTACCRRSLSACACSLQMPGSSLILDRIEPLNALKYAAHAANLVEQATGQDPSDGLISIISEARSELSGLDR